MNRKKPVLIIVFCMLSILLLPCTGSFAEESVQPHVFDYEGYLSESEASKLEEKLADTSKDADCQIIVITSNSLDGKDATTYLEDFFDSGFDQKTIQEDSVLLVFGKNSSGRFVEIQGYGICEYYMNNDRIENTLDEIIPYLKEEEYYDAFVQFSKEVKYYMGLDHGVSFDPTKPHGETATASSKKPFYYTVWFQLLISCGIGAVAVLCMAHTSGGTMTAGGKDYFDSSHSGVTARRDDYIRTTITKMKKPDPPTTTSSHSGYRGRSSGGGGVSRGGHSHSGGGRSF